MTITDFFIYCGQIKRWRALILFGHTVPDDLMQTYPMLIYPVSLKQAETDEDLKLVYMYIRSHKRKELYPNKQICAKVLEVAYRYQSIYMELFGVTSVISILKKYERKIHEI